MWVFAISCEGTLFIKICQLCDILIYK